MSDRLTNLHVEDPSKEKDLEESTPLLHKFHSGCTEKHKFIILQSLHNQSNLNTERRFDTLLHAEAGRNALHVWSPVLSLRLSNYR